MNNGLVDVVIGLVLMYLLLSLICTIANEYINQVMDLRAKTLRAGVEKLIDDPTLRQIFLKHGMIQTAKAAPATTEVLAAGQKKAAAAAGTSANNPSDADPEAVALTASYLSGRSVAMALLDAVNPGSEIPGAKEIVDAINKLPPSNIKDVLVTSATHAEGNIDKIRTGVASWFDDSMDRLGGTYKRYMQYISLAVGLFIAIALNADTLVVANALWSDHALGLRVEQVAQTVDKNVDPAAAQKLQDLSDSLTALPIGWGAVKWMPEPTQAGNLLWLVLKLVGWALTALAISLGAPFWFDTLDKFMSIRNAGAKPKTEAANG